MEQRDSPCVLAKLLVARGRAHPLDRRLALLAYRFEAATMSSIGHSNCRIPGLVSFYYLGRQRRADSTSGSSPRGERHHVPQTLSRNAGGMDLRHAVAAIAASADNGEDSPSTGTCGPDRTHMDCQ